MVEFFKFNFYFITRYYSDILHFYIPFVNHEFVVKDVRVCFTMMQLVPFPVKPIEVSVLIDHSSPELNTLNILINHIIIC